MSQQNNKPVKSFKAGWVEASIWRQEAEKDGKTIVNYSVRIHKQYRKKDDTDEKRVTYETTSYFFKRDISDLLLVANKAYEYLALRESNEEEIPV
jgi:hypothetical protein